jgi:hypothetical protein
VLSFVWVEHIIGAVFALSHSSQNGRNSMQGSSGS